MPPRNQVPPSTREGKEAPSFEEALERLETIVEELEGGSLTLEQSISRYEEGMGLSRRLTQTLDEAEKRIERLVESADGTISGEPMDLESEAAESASSPEPQARAGERRAPLRPSGTLRPRPAAEPDELPF